MSDDLPIIDAHHHFWDLSLMSQPWLNDEPQIQFRYGDYAAIRQDFLAEDYRRATAGHNVVASVTMEAEWDEKLLVGETEWTKALHRENARFPAAHIARTILHAPDAEVSLARHARGNFVRGIRHKPAAATAPDRIEKGLRGSMTDPAWRRGYRALQTHGFHFELQAPWWHVDELLDLVSAFPQMPVVINHAFLPADRTPEAMAGWRQAIKRAASAPQIAMKISGIGLKGRLWSLDDNRIVIDDLIAAVAVLKPLKIVSNEPVRPSTGKFEANIQRH